MQFSMCTAVRKWHSLLDACVGGFRAYCQGYNAGWWSCTPLRLSSGVCVCVGRDRAAAASHIKVKRLESLQSIVRTPDCKQIALIILHGLHSCSGCHATLNTRHNAKLYILFLTYTIQCTILLSPPMPHYTIKLQYPTLFYTALHLLHYARYGDAQYPS